ncbi:hypothetical protein, partial [Desulfovibrio sp.]|uniref:hypothetical protein n=1 Tax=Desulfovibrio sp. TaxID=885 RepID=UPI0025BEBC6A
MELADATAISLGTIITPNEVYLFRTQKGSNWMRFTGTPRSKARMLIFLGYNSTKTESYWTPTTDQKESNKFLLNLQGDKTSGFGKLSAVNKGEVWSIPITMLSGVQVANAKIDADYVSQVVIPWCKESIDRL